MEWNWISVVTFVVRWTSVVSIITIAITLIRINRKLDRDLKISQLLLARLGQQDATRQTGPVRTPTQDLSCAVPGAGWFVDLVEAVSDRCAVLLTGRR